MLGGDCDLPVCWQVRRDNDKQGEAQIEPICHNGEDDLAMPQQPEIEVDGAVNSLRNAR